METVFDSLNPHKRFLSGSERFVFDGQDIGHSLLDYWSWSFSDIYNNIYRGILAEYIVATALKLTPPDGDFVRVVWSPYDLQSRSGRRVEVKSAAYLQSWDGDPSKISFDIRPSRLWSDGVRQLGSSSQRNNDVYVFCLFKAMSRDVSILDLDWWDFLVLPTRILNEKKPNQKTITLHSLEALSPTVCRFGDLCGIVEASS